MENKPEGAAQQSDASLATNSGASPVAPLAMSSSAPTPSTPEPPQGKGQKAPEEATATTEVSVKKKKKKKATRENDGKSTGADDENQDVQKGTQTLLSAVIAALLAILTAPRRLYDTIKKKLKGDTPGSEARKGLNISTNVLYTTLQTSTKVPRIHKGRKVNRKRASTKVPTTVPNPMFGGRPVPYTPPAASPNAPAITATQARTPVQQSTVLRQKDKVSETEATMRKESPEAPTTTSAQGRSGPTASYV